jgi:hypothetical protein
MFQLCIAIVLRLRNTALHINTRGARILTMSFVRAEDAAQSTEDEDRVQRSQDGGPSVTREGP